MEKTPPIGFSINVSDENRRVSNKSSTIRERGKAGGRIESSTVFHLGCSILRLVLFDGVLTILFALFVSSVVLHKLHDEYLHPQLQLMLFQNENRRFTDNTYYHRDCEEEDFTATTPEELMIEDHFTKEDSIQHMLTHGASIYPNLLTNETATELRDWIARENYRREGWSVIEQTNRYTWGIDINMHPALQTFWQELAANEKLMNGLEGIIGPDPSVIEFTAITSSLGAADQYMHSDVIHHGSAVKYARSFVPSYSLFIPLQDTTYEMGATHVCPGSHLCSEGDDICEEIGAFAVSGKGEGKFWAMGNGALLNQQTFHKGMGFTQEGAIDRVVLIATFAPRPIFRNGLESRQIGQGGSYSLIWHQWGHTFSDYLHADKRMTEPQKTLRSLGLIKGNGWNYISTLSMRMANEDTEMKEHDLEELLEEEDGLWFLPRSWQDVDEPSDISVWHGFGFGVLKRVEGIFKRLYFIGLGIYVFAFFFSVKLQQIFGFGKARKQSKLSSVLWFLFRIIITHGVVVIFAWLSLKTVEESNWAKSIRSRKLYRIPVTEVDDPAPSTIPIRDDILFVSHFTSEYLASYARVVQFAHPGNLYWRTIAKYTAAPYANLTQSLKKDFCTTLITEVREESRFLKQDEERFWTEVIDMEELIKVCHRDLTTASDPLLERLIPLIESLQSETKFGMFRETVMQTKIIPKYLEAWETRMLEKNVKVESTPSALVNQQKSQEKTSLSKTIYPLAQIEPLRNPSIFTRTYSLPPQPLRGEPYDGAWLQEGDRVEGLYGCDGDSWFPGTVTAAIPNDGSYDVAYDDGDTDEGLEVDCVRRLDE